MPRNAKLLLLAGGLCSCTWVHTGCPSLEGFQGVHEHAQLHAALFSNGSCLVGSFSSLIGLLADLISLMQSTSCLVLQDCLSGMGLRLCTQHRPHLRH